jgi:two-component system cell cycle response regulator CpdR
MVNHGRLWHYAVLFLVLFCCRAMRDKYILPTGGPVAPPRRCQTGPPHRILVVDDESDIRALLTAILAGSGYQVESAENGAVAWEALQAKPYDLLITDNNMPKISGVELVKNLRSARMELPVVMVAGIVPEDELAQNPSLKIAATLSKPFALADLLDTVTNVLRVAA